jgi:hypothetical protein
VPSLTLLVPAAVGGAGTAAWSTTFPPGFAPGTNLWLQAGVIDPGAVQGLAASNALQATTR